MGKKCASSYIYILHTWTLASSSSKRRALRREWPPQKGSSPKGLPAADTAEEEEEDDFDDDDDADLMHHRTEDDDDDDESSSCLPSSRWKTAMKPVVYLNAFLSASSIAFLAQETAFLSVPIGILSLLACARGRGA